MATIHDEIDNWLAADIHGELSEDERGALHTHLVECSACRKAHQENKVMNKILEETLAHEKPDPTFEQRMLSGFRSRIPQRTGLVKLLVDLMRLRAIQITAVAAVLLALVQIGRMITGEGALASRESRAIRPRNRLPGTTSTGTVANSEHRNAEGALDKISQLASGRSEPCPDAANRVLPRQRPTAGPGRAQTQEARAFADQQLPTRKKPQPSPIGNACSGSGQPQTDSQRDY